MRAMVCGCSACGKDHEMEFERTEELKDGFPVYKATCPDTGIEVFLCVEGDDEDAS